MRRYTKGATLLSETILGHLFQHSKCNYQADTQNIMDSRSSNQAANRQFLARPKYLSIYYDRICGRELVPRGTPRVHSCAAKGSSTTQAEGRIPLAFLESFRLRREEEPE